MEQSFKMIHGALNNWMEVAIMWGLHHLLEIEQKCNGAKAPSSEPRSNVN